MCALHILIHSICMQYIIYYAEYLLYVKVTKYNDFCALSGNISEAFQTGFPNWLFKYT